MTKSADTDGGEAVGGVYHGITMEELRAKWNETVHELAKRDIAVTNPENALEGALSIRYNNLMQAGTTVLASPTSLFDMLGSRENVGSCYVSRSLFPRTRSLNISRSLGTPLRSGSSVCCLFRSTVLDASLSSNPFENREYVSTAFSIAVPLPTVFTFNFDHEDSSAVRFPQELCRICRAF